YSRQDPRLYRPASMRRALDVSQHVRGRRCLRSRAAAGTRKDSASGRSQVAPARARKRNARRAFHCGGTGMSLTRTSAIVLRHLYLVSGSPARVLPLFAWVAIDMVLWGFITKYLNTVSSARIDFVPVFLGAVLLWDFFTRVMHGVTMAFMEDVWSRNF